MKLLCNHLMATDGPSTLQPSQDPVPPTENALFDYLPASHEEYAVVEKKLLCRIDSTLMPVMISMIVLK